MSLLKKTNLPVDWWMKGNWWDQVVPPTCPTEFTFDSDVYLFSSSCPIFDLGVDSIFTFDSLDYLFSSNEGSLNVATFDAYIEGIVENGDLNFSTIENSGLITLLFEDV